MLTKRTKITAIAVFAVLMVAALFFGFDWPVTTQKVNAAETVWSIFDGKTNYINGDTEVPVWLPDPRIGADISVYNSTVKGAAFTAKTNIGFVFAPNAYNTYEGVTYNYGFYFSSTPSQSRALSVVIPEGYKAKFEIIWAAGANDGRTYDRQICIAANSAGSTSASGKPVAGCELSSVLNGATGFYGTDYISAGTYYIVTNGSATYIYSIKMTIKPADIEQFTIKFDVNGGTPEIGSQQVKYGALTQAPKNLSKQGFVLHGWHYADENGADSGIHYDFDSPVTSDFTLIAVWYEAVSGVNDKIIITVAEGADLDKALPDKVNVTTYLNENVTIGVKWLWNKEDVVISKSPLKVFGIPEGNYALADGTEIFADVIVKNYYFSADEKLIEEKGLPEREGFEFAGWIAPSGKLETGVATETGVYAPLYVKFSFSSGIKSGENGGVEYRFNVNLINGDKLDLSNVKVKLTLSAAKTAVLENALFSYENETLESNALVIGWTEENAQAWREQKVKATLTVDFGGVEENFIGESLSAKEIAQRAIAENPELSEQLQLYLGE